MAAKSKEKVDTKKARSNIKKLRTALDQAVGVSKKEKGNEPAYERQVQEQDPFSTFYTSNGLAVPPYSFTRLYSIYEESDILQACVEAMQRNVDGFGYDLQFIGDELKERDNPDVQAQYEKLTGFFDMANEMQSFTSARQQFREDFEVLGIGGF